MNDDFVVSHLFLLIDLTKQKSTIKITNKRLAIICRKAKLFPDTISIEVFINGGLQHIRCTKVVHN